MNTYASTSVEFLRILVKPPLGTDPTTDVVQIGFTPDLTAPAISDLLTASWETPVPAVPPNLPRYFCRLLIGPSPGHTLAVGIYQVWTRVSDNPEAPVVPAGSIKVV